MKNWLTLGTIILGCLILAFAGPQVMNELDKKNNSTALAKSFDDLAAITADTDLIVRAHISAGFTILEIGTESKVRNQVYNIAVQNVYKNESHLPVENETQLKLAQLIAFKLPHSTSFHSVVDESKREIEPGVYLLFLKTVEDTQTGETYVVRNSPNHLYKWNGNTTFKNIASNKLKSIKEDDLVNVLN